MVNSWRMPAINNLLIMISHDYSWEIPLSTNSAADASPAMAMFTHRW